ncbi:ABC transporter permease [Actinoplanes regularis]|uniref:Nucleoside ABC transporter membrane protein n=1 Tax=Actinoplanes regularis TaxID=52697 RepID=A0A238VCN3_9ACTN|nr:ABC transporter permease [Actinoplanes regularis]GIE83641.1 ABC transporter permease [Actinoplanes regularis]GLW29534.1 ABC transporter permease [Actinoplanes regularis]SNR31443.1 nucleoside ABC transporter membrane protein [Actinoplanes regularis]
MTAEPTTEKKPVEKETFLNVFLRNLWSSNSVTVTALSIFLAVVIGAVLIVVSDSAVLAKFSYFTARPGDALEASWALISAAYSDLLKGALGDPEAFSAWFSGTGRWQDALAPISETLTYAAPLVFTGLSVSLAFRGGLFNIGAQGQAVLGCIAAGLAGFTFGLPIVLNLVVALVAGVLGGVLWGFLPGLLKARTGAHEVITTIMLNYTAGLFLAWLVIQNGVQAPGRTDAISKAVASSAQLPSFGGVLRVHLGIVLAVIVTAGVAWLLNRSAFGFELRAVGANPHAAQTAGISVARTYTVLMAVAGGLAGLGGATQVLGTAYALTPSVAGNIGFDGLLVALLGRNRPWGTLMAALLFGALRAGGNRMQSYSGISLELVNVLQALIVIFIAAPALVKAIFRLRAARSAGFGVSPAKG